ncbi:MAG: hypothetical protein ACO1N3_04485 [Gammaproteobacteria bacterium]
MARKPASKQIFLQEKQYPLGVKISLDSLSLKGNILSLQAYMIRSLPNLVREFNSL